MVTPGPTGDSEYEPMSEPPVTVREPPMALNEPPPMSTVLRVPNPASGPMLNAKLNIGSGPTTGSPAGPASSSSIPAEASVPQLIKPMNPKPISSILRAELSFTTSLLGYSTKSPNGNYLLNP